LEFSSLILPLVGQLKVDQVIFVPLCEGCAGAIDSLGRPVERHDARDMVIVR
jgi:hypothetical protein